MSTPRVLIPVGLGLNCEEETAHAFELLGHDGDGPDPAGHPAFRQVTKSGRGRSHRLIVADGVPVH